MIRLETPDGSESLTLPLSVRATTITAGSNPALVSLPGAPPALTRGSERQALSLTLAGELFGDDLQAQRDTLAALLEHPLLRVYPHHESERHWLAAPSRRTLAPRVTPDEAEVSLEFLAPDAAQQGDQATVPYTNTAGLSFSFSHTVPGTAPALPELELTCGAGANFQDLRITTDDGALLELSGSFTAGQVVVFDAARYRLTVNGQSQAHRITDEAALSAFLLRPGLRTLYFVAGGSVLDVSAELRYRPRWY